MREFPIRIGGRSRLFLRFFFGVRLDLRDKLRYGPLPTPAIYVGVEDLDGFAAALAELGIPGEDARTTRD